MSQKECAEHAALKSSHITTKLKFFLPESLASFQHSVASFTYYFCLWRPGGVYSYMEK